MIFIYTFFLLPLHSFLPFFSAVHYFISKSSLSRSLAFPIFSNSQQQSFSLASLSLLHFHDVSVCHCSVHMRSRCILLRNLSITLSFTRTYTPYVKAAILSTTAQAHRFMAHALRYHFTATKPKTNASLPKFTEMWIIRVEYLNVLFQKCVGAKPY